jgi:hypothetical protein
LGFSDKEKGMKGKVLRIVVQHKPDGCINLAGKGDRVDQHFLGMCILRDLETRDTITLKVTRRENDE